MQDDKNKSRKINDSSENRSDNSYPDSIREHFEIGGGNDTTKHEKDNK